MIFQNVLKFKGNELIIAFCNQKLDMFLNEI